jgi:Tfp pilus assembly protein PilF
MFVTEPQRPGPTVASAPITQIPVASPSEKLVTPSQVETPLTSLMPSLEPATANREKPVQPLAPAAVEAGTNASPAAPPAPRAAPPARPVRDTIKITTGGATSVVNPTLTEAYQALNAGNVEQAQRLYAQLLRNEPENIDALLGAAAVAGQQGDTEQASRHYLKLLELEPRNAFAQAGLISMLGRADPLAAETRLKQLITQDPSAYLYFTLGNLYADQNRWPDAQQAYFQAHYLQSDNPDYAYNLAVGLEHIGQPKLALNFYRRAMQSVAAKGRPNFSTAAAEARISKLEKAVD